MMNRDEQRAQSAAVALAARGILTERAARAMAYFSRHGVFCEAMQSGGEMGIVLLEHWYTPAAFNALMEGRYAPTDGDVALAVSALAAPEPPAASEPPAPAEPAEPDSDADRDDDPDAAVPAELTGMPREAWQELRAAYARPEGEGVLLWALGSAVAVALFILIMAWGYFHQV